MKVEFESTRFEVPSPRNGRPCYRWVEGVYVVLDGKKIYPPMRIREAKSFVAEVSKERSQAED
jgi:hypothetical protein